MKRKRILVLTDNYPWGHRSIAKAIFGYLKSKERESDYRVDYTEVRMEVGWGEDLYVWIYRYIPATNRIAHKLMLNETAREMAERISLLNIDNLRRVVSRYKPDLIISSYFFHSHGLAEIRKREGRKFELWTVVADPWTMNPISYVKEADLHLVYDEKGLEMGRRLGIEDKKILVSGWWTRAEMFKKYDRNLARRKLGIYDERPVVFVGGGSMGTNSITKILPVLLLIKRKLAVIFNTGVDKLGYGLVQQYIRLFKKLRKDDLIMIKNLGWIENMGEVLSACDIVFGKAGPNFLFDTVAAGKPFVAITHIGGQEDGNIEIIKRKKLGWVKEDNGEAGRFLLDYLADTRSYNEKFQKSIREEAERNSKSLPMLWNRLK